MLRRMFSVATVLALLLIAPLSANSLGGTPPISLGQPTPSVHLAQLTHNYFVGEWETDNQEFNRDVQIFLTLWGDGRLAYHFKVDGVLSRGSTGTWWFHGTSFFEEWLRPDGSRGSGHGQIEKIDDDTFRLTIIDNGFPEYKGLVRTYRRRGPPQLSMLPFNREQ